MTVVLYKLLSSQAAEGEAVPAIDAVGRVDARRIEIEVVCTINVR